VRFAGARAAAGFDVDGLHGDERQRGRMDPQIPLIARRVERPALRRAAGAEQRLCFVRERLLHQVPAVPSRSQIATTRASGQAAAQCHSFK